MLAIVFSIPGFGIAHTIENLLPPAVIDKNGAMRVAFQALDVPGIVNAIAIGRKCVGYYRREAANFVHKYSISSHASVFIRNCYRIVAAILNSIGGGAAAILPQVMAKKPGV